MRSNEHNMENLEHKGLIYLSHNSFLTKNRTTGSDEYKALMAFPRWAGNANVISIYEIWYPLQGIEKEYYIPWYLPY